MIAGSQLKNGLGVRTRPSSLRTVPHTSSTPTLATAPVGGRSSVRALVHALAHRVQSRTLVLVSVLHNTLNAQKRALLNMFEPWVTIGRVEECRHDAIQPT